MIFAETREDLVTVIDQYKKQQDEITKSLMIISISTGLDYHSVARMTPTERDILIEVMKEKQEAEKKAYEKNP